MANQSYPNERDCEHGSMRGKCNICDLQEDIAKLEAENDKLRKELELKVTIHKNQAKRDLLQQAKGVDDFTCELLGKFRSHVMRNDVMKHSGDYIEQLRKQAEGE